jgi:Family of unknown function (DUF6353)
MALSDLIHKISTIAQQNSTGILTGVGVAGTISTAVLTARATFKAVEIIKKADENFEERAKEMLTEGYTDNDLALALRPMDMQQKAKLVWKAYIPPFGVGVITISSIILANRVAGKQAAALAAAYSVSERALSEYREKVIEKLGESKESDIRDMVAEARMKKQPLNSREIIIAGTGDVLCFDILSGRYFQSSVEEIKKAENTVNFEIVNFMHCSLSKFYDEIGLPATGFSDHMGFNTEHRCQVRFSTQMSSDDRPCLAIDFLVDPIHNYHKLWD